jgi:sortase A
MTAGRGFRLARWLFTLLGLAALGYCAAVWIGAKLYQARESRRFVQESRCIKAVSAVPRAASPAAPVVPPDGDLVGELEIPRIGMSVMVVEGTDARDLRHAVGHIPGTALPGERGNIGLAGHRDTFFRPLRDIHREDTITLRTLRGSYRYRVVSTRLVPPGDVRVLDPTGRDTLTLVTCFPFEYVGAAPLRFIVRADRLPGA